MRDPYHSARVRFKVARDRWINKHMPWYEHGSDYVCKANCVEPLEQTVERYITLAKRNPSTSAAYKEFLEAAAILQTMLKWKISDERQALLLWKLTRD